MIIACPNCGRPTPRPLCTACANPRPAKITAAILSLSLWACAGTPATRIEVKEVKVPVAIHALKPDQVPAVPKPLGPRPPSLSAAADTLLAAHCEFVAYALKADPLIRLSAGLPQLALPPYPECGER